MTNIPLTKSSTKDLLASACHWQGEATRYEAAYLHEVARHDELRGAFERAVDEVSELRAKNLRQVQTISYLQREYEHASADRDYFSDRLHGPDGPRD